jgi:uncharacterized hydrophobic protein (TIGR00341 family)
LAGTLVVIGFSALMGFIFKADPTVPEIATRTHAGLADIILAFASGCAGVLAFTTGLSSAIIGVMVAVALLPPLAVSGLLIGSGHIAAAFGALLLFFTNIICINLAGVLTFLSQGVSPQSWWQADKAKKATRKALMLWSLILAVLAGIIYIWQTGL